MKTIDPFDLTPQSIQQQKSAIDAMTRYSIFAIVLSGLLVSLIVTRWQQRGHQRLALKELMTTATPIRDHRLEALRLQQSTEQMKKLMAAVASARPRDSLLQSLAATTEGVVDFGLQPRQLHLRLAVEPRLDRPDANWAVATMKMTVETKDDSLAIRAHESISDDERFGEIKSLGLSKLAGVTRTELIATPRAEVLLP